MDEEILPAEAFSDDLPLDELLVSDLPPLPRRNIQLPFLRGVRAKLIAATGVFLVVAVLAGVRWGSGPLMLLAPATPTPIPIQTIAGLRPGIIYGASDWQQISLPVANAAVEQMSAATDDPNRMYICSGMTNAQQPVFVRGPNVLWRTSDGGGHWKPVQASQDANAFCHLSFDANNPQHIAVYEDDSPPDATKTLCAGSIVLSNDGGDTWQTQTILPLHTASPYLTIYCQLDITIQALYLTISYTNNADTTKLRRDYEVTMRSVDNGTSWQNITPLKEDGYTYFWLPVVSGDMLIGHSVIMSNKATTQSLWESHDAGTHWQRVMSSSPVAPSVLFPLPNTANSFYGMTGTAASSDVFFEHALYSTDASDWRYLPNISPTNTSTEHAGIFSHLGCHDTGQSARRGNQ